jgi:hypothetical protein
MKIEDQNIAVWKALGWRQTKSGTWFSPANVKAIDEGRYADAIGGPPRPDVTLDLMHEAEETLNWDQQVRFRSLLCDNSDGPNAKHKTVEAAMCHATKEERREAFVKTIGKWQD